EKSAKTAKSASAKGGKPKKKKNGKKIAIVVSALAVLLIAAGAVFGLIYTGYIDIIDEKTFTYEINDVETLVKYLKHPSLKAGDTLNINAGATVDVDEVFGGYAILPLVNYSGTGTVQFTGGTVVLAGGAEQSSMDNVSFSDCELYIDAPNTALTWKNASNDENINAATLNGTPHLKELSLVCVGSKTTIPVKIKNVGSGALSDAKVKFTSASCVFTEGDTYVIPDMPAGGEITYDVPVIITEAGRIKIVAYGTDESGKTVLLGESDYFNVAGEGYFSGDIHTHTKDGVSKRESNIDDNIKYAYEHGMSFMYSVENRKSKEEEWQDNKEVWAKEEAERLKREKEEAAKKKEEEEKEEANKPTDPAAPPQTPAGGTSFRGSFSLPVMTVGGDGADEGDIKKEDMIEKESDSAAAKRAAEFIGKKVEQSKVDSITGADGQFLQIPAIETGQRKRHMLIYGAEIAPASNYGDTIVGFGAWTYQEAIYEATDAGGLIVLPHFFKGGDIESSIKTALSVDKVLGIEVNSAGKTTQDTESKVEYNVWNNLNVYGLQRIFAFMSSNNYKSEDVGTQFIKGRNAINLAAETGTRAKARFYASDNSPLTNVTLYRYDITGKIEDLAPVVEFTVDLTGQGAYSYTGDVEVELVPNCYYRVEAHSESNIAKTDVGMGLSNPIWVEKELSLKNTTMLDTLNYKFGGEVMQAPNGTYFIKSEHFTKN
ncbi:MAG: hypothetical protein RR933_05235, partial [Oscillospiraceae bacterium]